MLLCPLVKYEAALLESKQHAHIAQYTRCQRHATMATSFWHKRHWRLHVHAVGPSSTNAQGMETIHFATGHTLFDKQSANKRLCAAATRAASAYHSSQSSSSSARPPPDVTSMSRGSSLKTSLAVSSGPLRRGCSDSVAAANASCSRAPPAAVSRARRTADAAHGAGKQAAPVPVEGAASEAEAVRSKLPLP
jgi:hypothetical protein